MTELANLYRAHIAQLQITAAAALARAELDTLVIASGAERYQFLDDRPYHFAVNPHFKHWLPLDQTHSWISFTPGQKPILVYFQPEDYWHVVPAAPSGYWLEHFDVRVITDASEAAQHLPKPGAKIAIIGETDMGLSGYAPNNPEMLLTYLHFYRAYKSEYELAAMRHAQDRAVRGHRSAEAVFRAQGSEYDIHMAYVLATGQTEKQLPYGNIVALNQHCAVLHYQHQRHDKPLQHLSFLLDAGASHLGYASDITRTYATHDGMFNDLIKAMDAAQLRLCDQVRVGNTNSNIHVAAHLEIGKILADFKLVNMSPEAMLAGGVTHSFFPHGIGHYLGLQVHDVGGYFKDDRGTLEPKPKGHKYLRLTREFIGNEVITIEPGLYFIGMLLDELAAGEHAGLVAWSEIDALKHYGGIRIEDDVRVCKSRVSDTADKSRVSDTADKSRVSDTADNSGAPENLTRNAFA